MNKDELLKELVDPNFIRQRFFANVRAITSYQAAQTSGALIGESPEFAKYLDKLNTTFTDPDPNKVLRFNLNLILAFLETIAENNQRLLALIDSEKP